MNDHSYLCGLCDTWHLPGECPGGAPAPQRDYCPRCREQRRGDGLLVSTYDARGKPVQACSVCGWGTVKAPRTPRKRGRRARARR